MSQKWKGKTDGTPWMQRTLKFCLGWMNLPFVYTGMSLVVPFYMIFNHQGYISQYHFFRRRLKYNPIKAFWNVYLNHFSFGQIILDRFAVYGGATFKLQIDNYDLFKKCQNAPEGFVQLSSHVGNFELAGYMLSPDPKSIFALVFGGESEEVMKNRERVLGLQNIHLIPVREDMSHVYILNSALAEGNIVSMPGDRMFGSNKSVKCQFFGVDTEFPLGPFIMAASRNTPVLNIFVMKESVYQYHTYVMPITLPEGQEKGSIHQRATAMVQVFASQLEDIVRRYPHQWFNYYEFWGDK